jgi:hypothetical protein
MKKIKKYILILMVLFMVLTAVDFIFLNGGYIFIPIKSLFIDETKVPEQEFQEPIPDNHTAQADGTEGVAGETVDPTLEDDPTLEHEKEPADADTDSTEDKTSKENKNPDKTKEENENNSPEHNNPFIVEINYPDQGGAAEEKSISNKEEAKKILGIELVGIVGTQNNKLAILKSNNKQATVEVGQKLKHNNISFEIISIAKKSVKVRTSKDKYLFEYGLKEKSEDIIIKEEN